LLQKCKIECPILIMSIVSDVLTRYGLEDYEQVHVLQKSGLLPSRVNEEILGILEINH
jgi:hypothetical protein